MASATGFRGYRFAVVGHPISSATDEELAEKARATLGQAADLLAAG